MTTQTRTLTTGVRQFIQDHLAEILLAESKGAIPGQPNTLSKKQKRRREDEESENDQDPEKELAGRMVILVEVFPYSHIEPYIYLSCAYVKELMNRLARPEGMSQWVDVSEDDVIVRCLVRANVALMHPSDGSKIRLVEFHKEVEGGEMEED